MTPIRDIKAENIRGVVYLQKITKGQVDGVKFYMLNGDSHLYEGEDLALALAVAKERFPAEPGSTRMSDQPLKE
jgi:hypothetical protein